MALVVIAQIVINISAPNRVRNMLWQNSSTNRACPLKVVRYNFYQLYLLMKIMI